MPDKISVEKDILTDTKLKGKSIEYIISYIIDHTGYTKLLNLISQELNKTEEL